MTPFRPGPGYDFKAVLRLIRDEFAYMDGRIDPPSSMHRLTVEGVAQQAANAELWVIEDSDLVGCVFLTPRADALYLGKLAVARTHRGRGLARLLVETAAIRAKALGLPAVELETRIELTENHAAFARLGFTETGRTAHPGYDRPTSVTMRRDLPEGSI